MYTQLWNKYVPIIRILMKRAVAQDQLFDLNSIDFERAGAGRKAGYKFTILFTEGRADNLINSPELAKDLVTALLEEESTKELIANNNYRIEMTTKFQLGIRFIPKPPVAGEEMQENR